MHVGLRISGLMVAVFLLSGQATARTVYVNTNAPGPVYTGSSWANALTRIQAGIDAAASGDEVHVAAGRYAEFIKLKNGVKVLGGYRTTSETDRTGESTIDGQLITGQGAIVQALQGVGKATVFDGFTIVNGKGSDGGAIYMYYASPVISHNTITDLPASRAIVGEYSSAMISFNTVVYGTGTDAAIVLDHPDPALPATDAGEVSDNYVFANGGKGVDLRYTNALVTRNYIARNRRGGIELYSGTPTVSFNQVLGNRSSSGAGVYCSSEARILSNTLLDNVSTSNGGAIYCSRAAAVIANNVIIGNAARQGGGIYVNAGTSIINNSIVGNDASLIGGGVYADYSAPSLANNIVSHNSSGLYVSGSYTPALRNNCFYNRDANGRVRNFESSTGAFADPTGASGNIGADPRLAIPTCNDVHLTSVSPCINTGDSSYAVGADRDNHARVGVADMGAYEWIGVAPPTIPRVVRVSAGGNDANDGSTWAKAKKSILAAEVDLVFEGGQIWVAQGTYRESIPLQTGVWIYGGFNGTESTLAQRNVGSFASTIDGQTIFPGVTSMSGGYLMAGLDGFIVTRGKYTDVGAGGIYAEHSSPAIRHCVVRANDLDGIGLSYSNAVVEACSITGNSNAGVSDYRGASRIVGNSITYNVGTKAAVFSEYSSTWVVNNYIVGNTADYGAGIRVRYDPDAGTQGDTVVANNLIAANNARRTGGGAYFYYRAVRFINNTVVGNTAGLSINTRNAGGIVNDSSAAVLYNNIISGHTTGISQIGSPLPDIGSNCLYNTVNYNVLTDQTGTNRNVAVDPRLESIFSLDFHLAADSPCRDYGVSNRAVGPTDLDGNPRIIGSAVDLGAYESVAPGGFSLTDAFLALRASAGLSTLNLAGFNRLNLVTVGASQKRIDAADAVAIIRIAHPR